MIALVETSDLVFFFFLALMIVGVLFLSFFITIRAGRRHLCPSPYTGRPLRAGSELNYQTVEKVLRFLYDMHEYDNRLFDLRASAICRETGRIFPSAKSWMGTYHVDWTFLQKRYPGHYVSWGSLSDEQQRVIRSRHRSLSGFQTEFSSPTASPQRIEPEFAYTKPGPLYVDVESGHLLGWKEVPGTDLEVLIVQKPLLGD